MKHSLTLFLVLMIGLIIAQPVTAQEISVEEITLDQEIPASDLSPVLEPMNTAHLQTLDKVTGRTGTAKVRVGDTVKLGTLFLSVKTCRKAPPIEQPEAAAFIQVWQPVRNGYGAQATQNQESEWVFSGWMFASSPSVSAMDHPVYDVWVIDCENR